MVEIDKIKLTQIEKAEYNPRTISEENYQKLKNSVKNFGLVEPILINLKTNVIIAGHQRYDVLTDLILTDGNLAEKEFYIIKYGDYGLILDTDEPTLENEDWEKALNITLNNTNLTGDYDFEKLGSLLDELSLSEIDVSLTGFDDFEIGVFSTNNPFENLYEGEYEDNEDIPSDFLDIEGEQPNQSYSVICSFSDKDTANKFIEYLGSEKELKQNTNSIVLLEEDIHFDE